MNPSLLEVSVTDAIDSLLRSHTGQKHNPSRTELIRTALLNNEAIPTTSGALSTWNPAHSTGRIPKQTFMVRDEVTQRTIDWNADACIPMERDHFDALMNDALNTLAQKKELFVLDRVVGHDAAHALPVRLITDSALSTLFADNMFVNGSADSNAGFTLIALPYDDTQGDTPRVVAMDFTRCIGLVQGTQYCGCIKKTLFTVLNYLLPESGVLPLHCSANEGPEGSALFLGLSGTGKTTLSNDPQRTLIGDDEHGWSDNGVFNMEGGCYAKLINLRADKEPDIFNAVFGEKPIDESGCIIENAMTYPDGSVDVDDTRLTENSRASYPLSFLSNTKEHAVTTHPKTIIFLTADASGVLPPVAKLSRSAAMFWFLMGYTSKLAGTELGVTEPKASFSRFFGAPFMPCHPSVYADLLGKKMDEHGSDVYLINTGWTGGPYGVGKRFDITLTRTLVNAALDGTLKNVEYRHDPLLKLDIPVSVPGIDNSVLDPASTWNDASAYQHAAQKLAAQFAEECTASYGDANLSADIAGCCPTG